MASAIDTAKPDRRRQANAGRQSRRRRFTLPVSRLGRTIIILNFLGLLILVIGALVINERQRALVNAQIDSLLLPGETIAQIIEEAAVSGEPEPYLNADDVRKVMLILFGQGSSPNRVRVFDAQGNLLADSYEASDRIEQRPLPPFRKPGGAFHLDPLIDDPNARPKAASEARQALESDIKAALKGRTVTGLRPTPSGDRVVSVTIPLKEVRAVTGVLTLDGANVDKVVKTKPSKTKKR